MSRLAGACLAMAATAALFACRPAGDAWTREASVHAALSPESAHVGDVSVLHVTITRPENARADLPEFGGGAVLARGVQRSGSVTREGWTRESWDVKLSSFEVGTHRVAAGDVRVTAADGSVTSLPFPEVMLRIDSLIEGTNATLRPPKPLAGWNRGLPRRFWWVLAAAAAAAVAAALIARRLFRRKRTETTRPPTPPHEAALRELRLLRERRLVEEGRIEEFHVELSAIVRRYIEDRFGLRAPERTTEEFIREATTSRLLDLEHQGLVTGFLEQCDLVKFARHRPGAGDMAAAFDAAERLVRETAPAPAPEGAAPP